MTEGTSRGNLKCWDRGGGNVSYHARRSTVHSVVRAQPHACIHMNVYRCLRYAHTLDTSPKVGPEPWEAPCRRGEEGRGSASDWAPGALTQSPSHPRQCLDDFRQGTSPLGDTLA